MRTWGLFDRDGDTVENLFGYTHEDAANEALGEYENGGRETYEDVHVAEMCDCPSGSIVHPLDVDCGAWV